MAKKQRETKERATVSRERRLALALRAVLDAVGRDTDVSGDVSVTEAYNTLDGLGYKDLEGIPKQVTRLNDALKIAVENGDGKEIARLGLELERAKSGKLPRVKPQAKAKTATGDQP